MRLNYFQFGSVAEWPPFGKYLLTQLTICSLCFFLLFVILVISRFGFEGWIWVLIVSVPDLCICFTLISTLHAFVIPTKLCTFKCGPNAFVTHWSTTVL